MADVDFKDVKELRNKTGVGINLCKEALEKSDGDFEKAVLYIRKKGAAKAEKRSGREASEGVIGVYLHGVDQRVAALVELNCETDFVAKNDEFQALAHDLAMQVAAMKARWVDRDSIPKDILEKETEVLVESDDLKDKPDNVKEKIVEGKLAKFYKENCLMEQEFFKDDSLEVKDLIDEAVAKIGEKIVVSAIYRMEVGG